MKLDANATCMELLQQKKRLVLARCGHKLLKDKQDELIRRFLVIVKDYQELRKNVESKLSLAFESFWGAQSVMPSYILEETLFATEVELNITTTNIMNIVVPQFNLEKVTIPSGYGFADTSCDLDIALQHFCQALPLMIQLAAKEKAITLLSSEIAKTRRRVNALEHVLIPNLEETIHYIRMRLEEMERSALTRLIKIKDVVRGH